MDNQSQTVPQPIRLPELTPGTAVSRLMSVETARRYVMLPLWAEKDELFVACVNPQDRDMVHAAAVECRRSLRPLQAGFPHIRAAVENLYNRPLRSPEKPDLLQLLYFLGHLDQDQRQRVETERAATGETIEQICRRFSWVADRDMAQVKALQHYMPYIRLDRLNPPTEMALMLPWDVARERQVLPLWWLGQSLLVGVYQPLANDDRLADISALVGAPVVPVLCPRQAWERVYRQYYLSRGPLDERIDSEIAEDLIAAGKLRAQDKLMADSIVHQTGKPLGQVLADNEWIRRSEWLSARARLSGMHLEQRRNGISRTSFPDGLLDRFPEVLARRLGVVPLRVEKSGLVVAIANPDSRLQRLANTLYGGAVTTVLMDPEEIAHLQTQLFTPKTDHGICRIPELGELLKRMSLITAEQLAEMHILTDQSDCGLGAQLAAHGYLDEADLAELFSIQTGIPSLSLDHARLDQSQVSLLPEQVMLDHQVLPLWGTKTDLWVAIAEPCDTRALLAVEKASSKRVLPVLTTRSVIVAALERLVGRVLTSEQNPLAYELTAKLVDTGFLTQEYAAAALRFYELDHLPLDQAVSQAASRSPIEVGRAFARLQNLDFIDLQLVDRTLKTIDPLGKSIERSQVFDVIEPDMARLIPLDVAQRLSAIPVRAQKDAVVVAFANPLHQSAVLELEGRLQKRVLPVMAARSDLAEAIQRNLHRRNLGTHLLLNGVVTRAQLNDALDYARRTGVRLGKALISRGVITWDQLYQYLSEQSSIPFRRLAEVDIDKELAGSVDPVLARKHGFLPVAQDDHQVTLALVDPYDEETLQVAREALQQKLNPILMTEKDFDLALDSVFSSDYLDQSISELLERTPENSAFRVLSRGQIIAFAVFGVISAVWLFLNPWSYLISLNVFLMIFYLVFTSYRFYLIYRSLARNLEISVSDEEIASLNDADLPVYTLLVPVYKEAKVLPALLESLNKLDYPSTKLDIKILLEEDDVDTIEAFKKWKSTLSFPRHCGSLWPTQDKTQGMQLRPDPCAR